MGHMNVTVIALVPGENVLATCNEPYRHRLECVPRANTQAHYRFRVRGSSVGMGTGGVFATTRRDALGAPNAVYERVPTT